MISAAGGAIRRQGRIAGRSRHMLGVVLTSAALVVAGCGAGSDPIAAPSSLPGTTGEAATTSIPGQPDAGDPSPGCSAATATAPGRRVVPLTSGGMKRSYVLYVPAGLDATTPAPLVIDFPAYSPASLEESFSGFTQPDANGKVKADEVGAVVVTPEPIGGDGTLRAWNLTDQPRPDWPDDHAFVADVMTDVGARTCIDRRRVLAMGFAVGGSMASEVACRSTKLITVLATVSGLYDPSGCDPQQALPVLEFHGTADRFIPYDGGVGSGVPDLGLGAKTTAGLAGIVGQLKGAVGASEGWAKHDGCDPQPRRSRVAATVVSDRWTCCRDGSTVELYTLQDAGHTWPGSKGMKAYEGLLGPVSQAIDANDIIWQFFIDHSPRQR